MVEEAKEVVRNRLKVKQSKEMLKKLVQSEDSSDTMSDGKRTDFLTDTHTAAQLGAAVLK